MVLAPDEAFVKEQSVAREFGIDVYHDDPDRTVHYTGSPFKMLGTPTTITRRAPHIDEHGGDVGTE